MLALDGIMRHMTVRKTRKSARRMFVNCTGIKEMMRLRTEPARAVMKPAIPIIASFLSVLWIEPQLKS